MVNAAVNEAPVARLSAANIFDHPDRGLIYFLSPSITQELVLNASLSTDPNQQDTLYYHFTCISGPDGVNPKEISIPVDENRPEIGLVTNIQATGDYVFEVLVEDNGTPRLSDKTTLAISVEAASPPKILVQQSFSISSLESGYLEIDASHSHSYDYTSLKFAWNATKNSLASYSGQR